jgi:hypothetical protein
MVSLDGCGLRVGFDLLFFTPPAGAHLATPEQPININYLYGFNNGQPQTWINEILYVILWPGVLWLVAFFSTHLVLCRIFVPAPTVANSRLTMRLT